MKIKKSGTTALAEKIGVGEKMAYGSGDIAIALVNLFSLPIIFFYTDTLGLNAGIIGTILLVSRFADGFTDIIAGYLIDRTHTRFGKARPWILGCSIPIAVSGILIYLVPNTGDVGKYIYVAITYNLATTFLLTGINLAYGTLNSLVTRDQNQRMSLNVYRMFMAQIGALIINAATLPLINAVGGSQHRKSWIIVSVIYGVISAILFLICFAGTKERVVVSQQQKEKISIGCSLKTVFQNTYWILVVVAWICIAVFQTMTGSFGVYYAKYILGNENIAGALGAALVLPVMVMLPFCGIFCSRFGKRNFSIAGSLIGLTGQLLIYLQPASAGWLIACTVIKGIGLAAVAATVNAMLADSIEYGQWKTGVRVEGMVYSGSTFGAKIAAGIASAVPLSVLAAAGYDGLAAEQSASVLAAIKNMYLLIPAIVLALLPILYSRYKLDGMYDKIMADLAKQEKLS